MIQTVNFSIDAEWLDGFLKDRWLENPKAAIEAVVRDCGLSQEIAIKWLSGYYKSVQDGNAFALSEIDNPQPKGIDWQIKEYGRRFVEEREGAEMYLLNLDYEEHDEDRQYYRNLSIKATENAIGHANTLKFLYSLKGELPVIPSWRNALQIKQELEAIEEKRAANEKRDRVLAAYTVTDLTKVKSGWISPTGEFWGIDGYYPLVHRDILENLSDVGIATPDWLNAEDNGWICFRDGEYYIRYRDEYTIAAFETLIKWHIANGHDKVQQLGSITDWQLSELYAAIEGTSDHFKCKQNVES